jgi:hypothetical protein
LPGMPEELPADAGGRENILAKVSPKGLPAAPIRNKLRASSFSSRRRP